MILDADRLAIFGLWPYATRRAFDLAGLRAAGFGLAHARTGERTSRVDLAFADARVVLHLRFRRIWTSLRARVADRTGRRPSGSRAA